MTSAISRSGWLACDKICGLLLERDHAHRIERLGEHRDAHDWIFDRIVVSLCLVVHQLQRRQGAVDSRPGLGWILCPLAQLVLTSRFEVLHHFGW